MLPIKKQVCRHIFQWLEQKLNVVQQLEKLLVLEKGMQLRKQEKLPPEREDKLTLLFYSHLIRTDRRTGRSGPGGIPRRPRRARRRSSRPGPRPGAAVGGSAAGPRPALLARTCALRSRAPAGPFGRGHPGAPAPRPVAHAPAHGRVGAPCGLSGPPHCPLGIVTDWREGLFLESHNTFQEKGKMVKAS